MSASAWPEKDEAPLDERLLVDAARLRLFGVNYLEGAVSPDLGLLAHLDGHNVLLLSLSTGRLESPPSACVAKIDLRIRRREDSDHQDGDGFTARGLSWARRRSRSPSHGLGSVQALPEASGFRKDDGNGGSTGERQETSTACGGEGGEAEDEVSDHLAVACGSGVRLWKVSRRCAREKRSRGGGNAHGYRFATAEVLTGWDRATNDTVDGDKEGGVIGGNGAADSAATGDDRTGERRNETPCSAAVERIARSLSFRPVWRYGDGSASRKDEQAAVPLAAWHDGGASVFGPGSNRKLLPAPVAKKRACGAWSGCGRRLAVSSGGEIRVYTSPCETRAVDGVDRGGPSCPVEAPMSQAEAALVVQAKNAWVTSDSRVAGENKLLGNETCGGAPPVRGHGRQLRLGSDLGAEDSLSAFRTVLCVEAAMQVGGPFFSPGSSPGGSSSPPSPLTSQRWGYEHDSESPAAFDRPSTSVLSSAGHTRKAESGPEHRSTVMAASRHVGDMRAMCPAGPLAFFGTTDGGLGLGSLLGSGGGSFSTKLGGGGRTSAGADELLGAVVSDSAVRAAAAAAVDTVFSTACSLSAPVTPRSTRDANSQDDACARRGGFRHVLPGENWLAGSLRPRTRDAPHKPSTSMGCSSESLLETSALKSAPSAQLSAEDPAISVGWALSPATVESATAAGASRLTSTSARSQSSTAGEIVDLRGKLGGNSGGADSGGGAAEGTHPLLRLSLGPGVGTVAPPSGGPEAASRHRGGDASGAANGQPWLVRVTCASTSCAVTTTHAADGPSGGGGDGAEVTALASLPPALSSPDLLASSEDGRFVVVGSHSCGMIACYRVSTRPTEAVTNENVSNAPGSEAGQEAEAGGAPEGGREDGGDGSVRLCHRRRRRRQRRAIPLCTLRLPSGYRAKGLAFAEGGDGSGRRENLVSAGSAVAVQPEENAAGGVGRQARTAEFGPVVLVLAACPVPSESAADAAPRGSRRGSAGGSSFRTVLLRFLLPRGTSGTKVPVPSVPLQDQPTVAGTQEATESGSRQSRAASRKDRKHPSDTGCSSGKVRSLPGPFERSSTSTSAMWGVAANEGIVEPCKEDEGRRGCASDRASPVSDRSPHRRQLGLVPPLQMGNQYGGNRGVVQGESRCRGAGSSFTSSSLSPRGASGFIRGGTVRSDGQSFTGNTPKHAQLGVSVDGRATGDERRDAGALSDEAGGSAVGGGAALEVALLEALAGVEGRINTRLDRIERVLEAVCDRVGSLERAVQACTSGNGVGKR